MKLYTEYYSKKMKEYVSNNIWITKEILLECLEPIDINIKNVDCFRLEYVNIGFSKFKYDRVIIDNRNFSPIMYFAKEDAVAEMEEKFEKLNLEDWNCTIYVNPKNIVTRCDKLIEFKSGVVLDLS